MSFTIRRPLAEQGEAAAQPSIGLLDICKGLRGVDRRR